MQGKSQTSLTITRDIEVPSSEQPLKKTNYLPNIQKEIDTKTEDDDWRNNGVSGASASISKKEDDDWLNANLEEVPTDIYKQQDDDWLNVENEESLETVDKSSLNIPSTKPPEIQI